MARPTKMAQNMLVIVLSGTITRSAVIVVADLNTLTSYGITSAMTSDDLVVPRLHFKNISAIRPARTAVSET
ncbi:hypothetical protein [Pseudovibrio exalbescens]|uniref:Uncharacterized protein n=1 Tax=Pseudovibrio exalbescens TaxID=197461 RepID=A0A1U7JBW0_9HYPH|nr:hypothetical protein [Pseudovibrio exalbescens]OKL42246.1 hypothetical protein A3843_00710 [Pseudovibrio exalbescens]